MILTYVLTGAHSTGKSSLLDSIRDIPGYSFSESVTRTSGAILNQDGNDEGQLKILQAIIDYERKNDLYKKDYILDRSFIDFLAYTTYLHHHGKVSDETLKIIQDEFDKRKGYYTKVFYLPIEFDIVADGVRSESSTFQLEIDSIIRSILYANDLGWVPISGPLDVRIDEVKSHIPYIDHIVTKPTFVEGLTDGFEYVDDNSYVMRHGDTIASLVSYKKTDRLKISYVFTSPAYRGSHFASKLLDKLLADNKGMVVYLYIKEDAMPFYKSYGLTQFIQGESIYSGPLPNYYVTFYNGDTLTPIKITDEDKSRIKVDSSINR